MHTELLSQKQTDSWILSEVSKEYEPNIFCIVRIVN